MLFQQLQPSATVARAVAVTETKSEQQERHDSREDVSTVCMDGLMQLWPRHLECQVWQSQSATKMLHALDSICLTNSIFISLLVVKVLGAPMSWLQWLQAVLYAVASAIQLLVMHQHKQFYQRHRFKVTLINRCLRILTVISTLYTFDLQQLQRFESAFPQTPQLQQIAHWLALLRRVVGVPLFYCNHANFVLPFAYVLVAQSVTCGGLGVALRVSTCYMLSKPDVAVTAAQLCQYLKVGMHYLGWMSMGRGPRQVATAAARECQGIEGFMLLSMYANVLILVIGPCLAVYFMELNLKLGFIQQQKLTLLHAPPFLLESRVSRVVVLYGAVVGSWMACEVAVLMLSPMQCDSASGMLLTQSIF